MKRYCWLSASPWPPYHCSIFCIVWFSPTSIQTIIHLSCWQLNPQAVEKLYLNEFICYLAVISWDWSALSMPSTIYYTWDFITLPSVLVSSFLRWIIGATINGYPPAKQPNFDSGGGDLYPPISPTTNRFRCRPSSLLPTHVFMLTTLSLHQTVKVVEFNTSFNPTSNP